MKILVVKLHALGDFVIHTPAFERIRKAFPDAEITLLTTNWTAPAAIGLPFFNNTLVVSTDLFFQRNMGSMAGLASLNISLNLARYDLVISFHKAASINKYLATATLSARLYKYAGEDSNRSVKLDETRHSAPNAVDLAELVIRSEKGRATEKSSEKLKYYWHISEEECSEAKRILADIGLESNSYAMIFPGGGSNPRDKGWEKRWKSSGFAEVARWLKNEKAFGVILSGSDSDQAVCADVKKLSGVNIIDLSGMYNIRTTAALMSYSKLVVSNDSAPMHIAAATSTFTVGIFGPTGAVHKLPPTDNAMAVSLGLPCSPCYYGTFKGCIFDSIRCMENLTSSKVIAAITGLPLFLQADRIE